MAYADTADTAEQRDADRRAAQQQLADAKQRRVDEHAAEERVEQFAAERA